MRRSAIQLTFQVALLAAVLALAAARPVEAVDIIFEQGIEYSNPDGQHLELNLARPEVRAGTAAGGALHSRRRVSRRQPRPLEHALPATGRAGYVAVTVTYRLAPQYRFPAAVHDVKAAVRWLRANAEKYGIDPARIGTLGDSAGGTWRRCLGVTAGVEGTRRRRRNAEQSSAVTCVVELLRRRAISPSRTTRASTRRKCCRCSWAATWQRAAARTSWPARCIGSRR